MAEENKCPNCSAIMGRNNICVKCLHERNNANCKCKYCTQKRKKDLDIKTR